MSTTTLQETQGLEYTASGETLLELTGQLRARLASARDESGALVRAELRIAGLAPLE